MYKRLREMTEEEIKELKDLEVVFYKKTYQTSIDENFYVVKVNVDKYLEYTLKIEKNEYVYQALLEKVSLESNYFKSKCKVRFGKISADEISKKDVYFVELYFNQFLMKTIILDDLEIEILKQIGLFEQIDWVLKE